MVGKYKVITLCGSTKFKDDFLKEQKRLLQLFWLLFVLLRALHFRNPARYSHIVG